MPTISKFNGVLLTAATKINGVLLTSVAKINGMVVSLATAFEVYKARVLADGGVVENESCATIALDAAGSPTLFLYPSGYKVSVLYSEIPDTSTGDFALARACTASRTNESGYLEFEANNVPRVDFTGGGCGILLSELQRINYNKYSEDFSGYPKVNLTIGSTTQLDPYNTSTATQVLENNGTGLKLVKRNSVVVPSGSQVTHSIFAKPNGRDWFLFYDSFHGGGYYFDVANGTRGSSFGTVPDGWEIEPAANGYYRIGMTTTVSGFYTGYAIYLASGNNSHSYTGDGTKGLDIMGAMVTVGNKMGSYIKTLNATSTRLIDEFTISTGPITPTVTSITETIGGVAQTPITIIPATYQISAGKINKVVMN